MTPIVIAVDFDGTCVEHAYPQVGQDIPHAVETLQELTEAGHKIILWTMRSGKHLDDAVRWYKTRKIPLYGINENPTQKEWSASKKAFAQLYIDDAALGCPLVYLSKIERPYVDWLRVKKHLIIKGIL